MSAKLLPPLEGSCLLHRYMTLADADLLASRLREGDRKECIAMGYHPIQALAFTAFSFYINAHHTDLAAARAVSVLSADRKELSGVPYLIGAFGWDHGSCWSVWADLTKAECKSVRKETPRWARWTHASALLLPLSNIVMASNKAAVKWLDHSGCFTIDRSRPEVHGGETFWPFSMNPLSEMKR